MSIRILPLILCFCTLMGQLRAQVYPVQANVNVAMPHSTYLSDYFGEGSSKVFASVSLNDATEASLQVRFRVSLEGNGIRLQSNPNISYAPYVITSGMQSIPNDVLGRYFNTNTMAYSGISASELARNNNRLPEGGYQLCVEVLEYTTGKLVSNKACTYIFMQLSDEPLPVLPACGSVILQTQIQNINFQWQPSSAPGAGSPLEYQLTVYEVTDKQATPQFALQNNKAQLIFTSDWQLGTNYLYSTNEPVLTVGKVYVYKVQARFQDGKALKNNGFSEPCYFYFGYPTGGLIPLKSPLAQVAFKESDPLLFTWGKPNNLLPGQSITYKINVFKQQDSQSEEEAVLLNPAFLSQTYPNVVPSAEFQTMLMGKLDKKSNYVWQVQAFTQNQLVAESEVRRFMGPALVESFMAGNHKVHVAQTVNSDLSKLEGNGYFIVDSLGTKQTVSFKDIQIQMVAGNFVLSSGTITGALVDTTTIRLSAKVDLNGYAYFHPRQYQLHRDGLRLFGRISWSFPHPTLSQGLSQVYTQPGWMAYEDFTLTGKANLAAHNNFDLLDPHSFTMELDPLSTVEVFMNRYSLVMHGDIIPSKKLINNPLPTLKEVRLPFSDADQLYYFQNNYRKPSHRILPIDNIGLHILPQEYVIDLSESQSPERLKTNPQWKGIYLYKSDVIFLKEFDAKSQMYFDAETRYSLILSSKDTINHHIDADGLTFTFNRVFSQGYSVKLNTFPAILSDFHLDIVKNTLNESHLNGDMYVPFVSSSQKFKFSCPVDYAGIRPGYMVGLEGLEFVFNPNNAREKLQIKINKAVFVQQERLEMSMEMRWPYLNLDLGNINGFALWGDYKIGFYTPNGTRLLEKNMAAKYDEYEYTASKIGAGRNSGAYSIGVGGSISISSDIAGEKGAPEVNLYSIYPNPLLPVELSADLEQDTQPSPTNETAGANALSMTQKAEMAQDALEKDFQSSVSVLETLDAAAGQYVSLPLIPSDQTLTVAKVGTSVDPDTSLSKNVVKGGLRAKLSDEEYKVLEQFVDEFIKLGYGIVGGKLDKLTSKVITKVDSAFNKSLKSMDKWVDTKTHNMMDSLAQKVLNRFKNKDSFDPTEYVLKVSDTIADELAREIKRSVRASVDQNLRDPIKDLIKVQITDSLHAFVIRFLQTSSHKLMNDEMTGIQIVEDFKVQFKEHLEMTMNSVLAFVKPQKLLNSCEKTCVDAIKGVDLGQVASRLTNGLLGGGLKSMQKAWEKLGETQINRLAHSAISQVPVLNAIAGPTIKLNFNNLGEKLKNGDIAGIVSIDPTNISVNTKFVSFSGVLKNEKNEIYGNVWRANVLVQIKRPKPFNVDAVYLSGKKNGRDYWFCQVSPAAADAQKPGGKLSKEPKMFSSPANIGPIQLVAGTARVYKHMKEIGRGESIVPDSLTDFGAYMSLVAFDAQNKGKTMRLAIEAEFILKEDDNYTVNFDGNVQIMNKTVAFNKIDPEAVVKGTLSIYYSSAESHLIASGNIEMLKPGTLCATAWMRYESKPGFFSLDIGDRPNPIKVVMACNGWGGLGFFHIDTYELALGVGIGYYADAHANFDIGVVSGAVGVKAGIEFMIDGKAQYNPTFVLQELGIWAHGYAEVYLDYKTALSSGHISLVSIDIVLEARLKFQPKPSKVKGLAKGRACFLSWCIGFEAGFEKNV